MNRLYKCFLNLKISSRFVIFLESVRRTCYLLVFLLPSSFPYENISAFRVLRKCCTCFHVYVCVCVCMWNKVNMVEEGLGKGEWGGLWLSWCEVRHSKELPELRGIIMLMIFALKNDIGWVTEKGESERGFSRVVVGEQVVDTSQSSCCLWL